MTLGLHGDFELLFLTRILVNDLILKEKRMINTYVSACECRAPCTHSCTRRSKKPCLLINEIFPRPDLNDPSLSVEHEDSRGRQRWNTEQSGGRGLSKGYKPELCGACGYSNTASQWGEKQTK